ncbi:MAG: FmdB family zinc ribbon protein [Methylophilaceae bacterium]
MPIYDFQCTSCGYQGEVMRKMSESNITSCPQCKEETFAKMLSAPSFQLSGSGWYATDFKGKKPENKTSTEPAVSAKETASAGCAPGCACH